jgi:hypothetical protein
VRLNDLAQWRISGRQMRGKPNGLGWNSTNRGDALTASRQLVISEEPQAVLSGAKEESRKLLSVRKSRFFAALRMKN